jgi:hypothetical protein
VKFEPYLQHNPLPFSNLSHLYVLFLEAPKAQGALVGHAPLSAAAVVTLVRCCGVAQLAFRELMQELHVNRYRNVPCDSHRHRGRTLAHSFYLFRTTEGEL